MWLGFGRVGTPLIQNLNCTTLYDDRRIEHFGYLIKCGTSKMNIYFHSTTLLFVVRNVDANGNMH